MILLIYFLVEILKSVFHSGSLSFASDKSLLMLMLILKIILIDRENYESLEGRKHNLKIYIAEEAHEITIARAFTATLDADAAKILKVLLFRYSYIDTKK